MLRLRESHKLPERESPAEPRAACQFLVALCPVCLTMLYRNICGITVYVRESQPCARQKSSELHHCVLQLLEKLPQTPQTSEKRLVDSKYLQFSKCSSFEKTIWELVF